MPSRKTRLYDTLLYGERKEERGRRKEKSSAVVGPFGSFGVAGEVVLGAGRTIIGRRKLSFGGAEGFVLSRRVVCAGCCGLVNGRTVSALRFFTQNSRISRERLARLENGEK